MRPKSRYFNLRLPLAVVDIRRMPIWKTCLGCLLLLGLFQPGLGQWDYAGVDHRDYISPALLGINGELRPAAIHPAASCRMESSGISMHASKPGWETAPVQFDVHVILGTGSGFFTPSIRGETLEGYQAIRVSLGYARKMAEWLDAGLKIHYDQIRAAGYRPSRQLFTDACLILNLREQWVADFSVLNIALLNTDFPFSFRPPMSVHAGIGYKLSALAGFGLGLLSSPGRSSSIQIHIVYRVHEKVRARLSYCTGANAFNLRLGFVLGRLQCGVNFAYMFPLGMTGGLDGQYAWGRETD